MTIFIICNYIMMILKIYIITVMMIIIPSINIIQQYIMIHANT